MSPVRIPPQATGRVGMLAMLQSTAGASHDGRVVLVCAPNGWVQHLSSDGQRAFSWEVALVGAPDIVDGLPQRKLVVADGCLKPLSELPAGAVDSGLAALNAEDFSKALDDYAQTNGATGLPRRELLGKFRRALAQARIRRTLSVVPVAEALQAAGFRAEAPGRSTLVWARSHNGEELRLFATPDLFDAWSVIGAAVSRSRWALPEARLPASEPMGRTLLTVLNLWRDVFSRSPVPEGLELGRVYEQHLRLIERVRPGLPTVWAARPEVFRGIVRMLRREAVARGPGGPLALRYRDGMLEFVRDGERWAWQVYGAGIDDCLIDEASLLALPAHAFNRRVRLEQNLGALIVNGRWVLPCIAPEPAKNDGEGATSG